MSKLKVTQCQGEGQGSCKRCNDNGKWNRAWMDFLYKIEGYEGCYCRDCVKELQKEQEERKVRTVEEIKKDYEETKVNDELVQDSHYKNCYGYKNEPKRKKAERGIHQHLTC